jgi:hypothetical protein
MRARDCLLELAEESALLPWHRSIDYSILNIMQAGMKLVVNIHLKPTREQTNLSEPQLSVATKHVINFPNAALMPDKLASMTCTN